MINEIVSYYCVTPSEQLPVEQELFSLREHLSLHTVFSLVRVARSLVLCVVHCGSLFVFFLSLCCRSFNLRMDSDCPFVTSNSSISRREQVKFRNDDFRTALDQ